MSNVAYHEIVVNLIPVYHSVACIALISVVLMCVAILETFRHK